MSEIVGIAKKDIGKLEKPNNSGFQDAQLEKELKDVGWENGFAWCCLICERWSKKAYPAKFAEFDKLFSSSAVTTFANFKKAGYVISSKPVVGSLVVWQKYVNGKPSWQGHIGVVSEVMSDTEFKSVEGNTNAAGSREGNTVAEKTRRLIKLETGLNILGFIILG